MSGKEQAEAVIEINSQETLDGISDVKLDLQIPKDQYNDTNEEVDLSVDGQPLKIPVKIGQQNDAKNDEPSNAAKVEVHYIGVSVIPGA